MYVICFPMYQFFSHGNIEVDLHGLGQLSARRGAPTKQQNF